ncbi:23S rRNA (adenine(2030)-N(6))-methyltransferase RlmJ [Aliiglaciecola sp. 2_MG-2023]|uniref:23S rRNA (adenine(2030)-N(6))-methyltransferase RlmJ n=1 Tax=unclassified Aliiglaciecola TaxID=2593648 RepID=UPI0026E44CDA|nr:MULTISPECIES: 23S rRNA (adenine(2030)-N(6))-methyltransferase RlmJ [unclassified Aliiglaciecola]MDO6710501.1 23S rRNA (adenine(2030)-N(6))-methyltransferase RlmJ [Aliiglaciecola sp. 2_MG-2023]MDO6751634.1 23S rRNA (adenine(2030)-N(6))-methyltransferase RlmJ [Aliiglaciecola sp. 1_MG-2023]
MLSYRHSFHAGNHADVLKHITQMLIIKKLKIKAKPAVYIDTHSGAGLYELQGLEAQKTKEFLTGITAMQAYQSEQQDIAEYQQLTHDFVENNQYPGSPLIAANMLREQDKIVCMELHNTEIDNLRHNLADFGSLAKVGVHHRDGYEGLLAILPPIPARGLVLIDPSYEVADEYQQVVMTLAKAIKKWSVGIFAIWYPLLSSRAGQKAGLSEKMISEIAALDCKSVLNVAMHVTENEGDAGMYGSGLIIVNAPWQLDTDLENVLPELVAHLGGDDAHGKAYVEWLKKPD